MSARATPENAAPKGNLARRRGPRGARVVGTTTSHLAELHVPLTKLHHPRRPADLIDRPQLVARLTRAVELKMTLLWAPAGYGKSTLLAIWAAAGTQQTAWLSLDEQDDTLTAFVRALIAAIQTVLPGVGKDTIAMLNQQEQPSPTLLAITLTDELSWLSDPLVLVLDNYDQIHSPLVHELMSEILIRLPERPHVVVASRTLPPLPLPTLRAEAQLDEIGVEDLRFGPAEARMFLDQSLDEHLPERTVSFLQERTEGWPVGLRLAAILLRDRPDREAVLAALATGSHEYIRDYLLDELLADQPADVRRFMLEISVLDRFCVSLCSAVVSRISTNSTDEVLSRLMRDGVMVVGLDEQGEWYRFHHLFEELLRRRLRAEVDPDEVAALHRRAAAWLAAEGSVIAAVRHLRRPAMTTLPLAWWSPISMWPSTAKPGPESPASWTPSHSIRLAADRPSCWRAPGCCTFTDVSWRWRRSWIKSNRPSLHSRLMMMWLPVSVASWTRFGVRSGSAGGTCDPPCPMRSAEASFSPANSCTHAA